MKNFIRKYWPFIVLVIIGIIFSYSVASYFAIEREGRFVYDLADSQVDEISKDIKVGIVLGGGVGIHEPSTIVKDRLDTAKNLLNNGNVDVLLLSGDNRVEDYNEPQVMHEYLLRQGVPADKMQRDFAGRSTYETCERAKKVFGVNSAFLITQKTHINRAIFLCRHFGIDAYGVVAETDILKRTWIYQNLREFFARSKAVFNVLILGEPTVLGEPIKL